VARIPEWHQEDGWGMDDTLARIIASAIRYFRSQHLHGSPYGLEPDEWNAILLEMKEGFQAYANSERLTPPRDSDKFPRAIALFAEYFTALWN
jgi:hypothetical protein